jgi:hypothetical protein
MKKGHIIKAQVYALSSHICAEEAETSSIDKRKLMFQFI